MDSHKSWVAAVFDRTAADYGNKNCSYFNYFGKRLTEQVTLSPGQHILDVATGRGAVLFPIADIVGPTGKVIGIDISSEMVKQTAVEAAQRKLSSVEVAQMDAEHLHFPDNTFDVVFCGFALFFFPAVHKALAECKRVLKPQGKFVVSTWGKRSELSAWVVEEAKKLVTQSNELAVVPLRDKAKLYTLLHEAGFDAIQIHEENKIFERGTPEEWWDGLWTHAIRAILEQLTPEQLTILRNKTIPKAYELYGDCVKEEMQVFYGIGQKI